MQSCRNVPWKPPSPWTLSLSLHKQPQSLQNLNLLFLKERGQWGLLWRETTLSRDTPGEMRISRDQPQQLPRDSSFLSTLQAERRLQPFRPAVQGGRIKARAISLGMSWATAWTCRCLFCCRQDSAAEHGFEVPEIRVIAQEVVQKV